MDFPGSWQRELGKLGLRPVDAVAQNPASPTQALPVPSSSTVPARTAGGDTGQQSPIAQFEVLDTSAACFDGPDRLMTEDPPVGDRRKVALQDVEMVAQSTRTMASVSARISGSGTSSQVLLPGP